MGTEYFIERCRGIFSNFVKWQLKSACINGLRAKICVYIVISAALFCLSFGDALCGLFFLLLSVKIQHFTCKSFPVREGALVKL